MGLFKRKSSDEQPRTCPQCCQILSAQAVVCDMCGYDLRADAAQEGTAPVASMAERRS